MAREREMGFQLKPQRVTQQRNTHQATRERLLEVLCLPVVLSSDRIGK